MAKSRKDPLERLMSHIEVTPSGCWEWQASRERRGYGHMRYAGRMIRAHRASWELHNGPIPAGMQVRHQCDNPPCVNPEHLLVGTYLDNERDKRDRGRTHLSGRSGEANSWARLTAEQVRQIRHRYATEPHATRHIPIGVSHRSLAREYGVAYQTIGHVLRRERWA